jgi:siroheme decarboxylase
MDDIDRAIIDTLQGDLPICEQPFLAAAKRLGIGEDELLKRLGQLRTAGVLTRIGPLFQVERMGGAFTLAALQAPAEQFDDIAQRVNAMPEIAHNYERGHDLNMWFVIATETPDGIGRVVSNIEQETGCKVFNFPKSREYFVEMKLKVNL